MQGRLFQGGADINTYHFKWVRFMPHERLNVDQTPFRFLFDTKKMYELV